MGWKAVHGAAVALATTVLGSIACNQTEGPCYRREDIEGSGSGGVGGGALGPGWAGAWRDLRGTVRSQGNTVWFDCCASSSEKRRWHGQAVRMQRQADRLHLQLHLPQWRQLSLFHRLSHDPCLRALKGFAHGFR